MFKLEGIATEEKEFKKNDHKRVILKVIIC